MKLTTLFMLASMLVLVACENPKPDMSGMDKDGDMSGKDTMNNTDDGKFAEVDSATMMKAWTDFMTPGDMHKWMAKWDGTWSGETSMWMEGPDAPPSKSTTTITHKMALNGLYQMGDFKGTMMGQPFEGHSILAYDNAKKKFINTWVDNMGSGIVIMTGDWNEGTQTLSLKGTQTNPVNGKDSNIREELKVIDDNTLMMTMYGDGPDGKEHKFMEATLTRKM